MKAFLQSMSDLFNFSFNFLVCFTTWRFLMRKTFVVLSFFCALISCGFCGEYGGGDGTPDNPYQIASVEHLVELGKTQSDYESHFILIADLDMAGTVYKRAIIAPDLDDKEWGPQGGKAFNGVFDGGGHTISNFTAENRSVDYLGLFGDLEGNAVIKNLHLVNANVKGGKIASCFAASLEGAMENCSVTGKLSGIYVLGGIVGFLDNASIKNAMSDVTITAYEDSGRLNVVGGLVAWSQFGTIDNCSSKCNIVAKNTLNVGGGLVGQNTGTITNSNCDGVSIVSQISASTIGAFCGYSNGSICNCFAFDFKVICKGSEIGGFVGSNNSLIAMSLAEGQVVGKSGIGGIAGKNDGYIIDCYSNVTAAAVDKVGGFAGKNSYGILRSYSIGKATSAGDKPGGFVGEDTGIVDISFWDAERSGNDFDMSAVSKRTSELKKRSTFKYWGDGVWIIDEGSDYPRLVWENTPGVVIKDDPVEYGGGTGTLDDPYLIYDAEDLTLIGVYPQDLEKHYRLMADIDMEGVDFHGIGFGFGFGGVFDGNGHVIRNYSVNNDLPYSGLFTVVLQTGILRNVVVEGFEVSGVRSVGGLCGKNEGLIEKCKASGRVYTVDGGKENTSWGGLAGRNYGRIVESLSDIRLDVICDEMSQLGGFVGGNFGVIEKSGSLGEIVCSKKNGKYIGGFMGSGGYDSKVYDCYSLVAVTVSGEGCELVGGFAGGQGFRTKIERSYCSGPVKLADDCKDGAAFIGYVDVKEFAAHSSVTNCFWNSDLEVPTKGIARESQAKIVISPATSEQLKDAAFLESAGWNISSVPNEKVWLLESGKLPRIYLP
jgi:hypothetical protein